MNLLNVLLEYVSTPRYYLCAFGDFYSVLRTSLMSENLFAPDTAISKVSNDKCSKDYNG